MRTGRPKVALILMTDERQRLESLAHRSRSAPHVARRARIILACAGGSGVRGRDPPPPGRRFDRNSGSMGLARILGANQATLAPTE